MKVLNFTAVEILPSLLDKTKVQTIRPAWVKAIEKMKGCADCKNHNKTTINKLPRFKVADKVRILWNQRSKYEWFCNKCGKVITDYENKSDENFMGLDFEKQSKEVKLDILKNAPKIVKTNCGCNDSIFNKHLGNVEITEVFKISMFKDKVKHRQNNFGLYNCEVLGTIEEWAKVLFDEWIVELAKLDGFSSVKQMFSYFDKKYDLSSPKKFWVYRWSLG